MHLQLDSRPSTTDVSADGLALSFCPTPGLDVVATLVAPLTTAPGCSVLVEVLGASHRVHLRDGRGPIAAEQVACLGGPPTPLPRQASHRSGGLRLEFTSSRTAPDARGLAAVAARLRAGDDDHSLVVSFPGHPDALTCVQVLPDGWETWHLYPGARPDAVRTRTRVVTP